MDEKSRKNFQKRNLNKLDENELPSWLTDASTEQTNNDFFGTELPNWLKQGEPFTKTLSLRVEEQDYYVLLKQAEKWGVTPSVAMRRIIHYQFMPELRMMNLDALEKGVENQSDPTQYLNDLYSYLKTLSSTHEIMRGYLKDIENRISIIKDAIENLRLYFQKNPIRIKDKGFRGE